MEHFQRLKVPRHLKKKKKKKKEMYVLRMNPL